MAYLRRTIAIALRTISPKSSIAVGGGRRGSSVGIGDLPIARSACDFLARSHVLRNLSLNSRSRKVRRHVRLCLGLHPHPRLPAVRKLDTGGFEGGADGVQRPGSWRPRTALEVDDCP
jgi:hypothetical protein